MVKSRSLSCHVACKFSGCGENCRRNVTDLAGSLVTSSRPPGRLQKRPDDRTWNAGVAVRTADGSRRTADAGCLRCGCSSPSYTVVRCYLPPGRCWRRAMSEVWTQQSVMYYLCGRQTADAGACRVCVSCVAVGWAGWAKSSGPPSAGAPESQANNLTDLQIFGL